MNTPHHVFDFFIETSPPLSGLDMWTRQSRIEEIERALKFDPYQPYRRELASELIALTEPGNDNHV